MLIFVKHRFEALTDFVDFIALTDFITLTDFSDNTDKRLEYGFLQININSSLHFSILHSSLSLFFSFSLCKKIYSVFGVLGGFGGFGGYIFLFLSFPLFLFVQKSSFSLGIKNPFQGRGLGL